MKINKDRVLQIIFTGLCAATFLTMFLPWFSVNSQMDGYYRGINAFFPALISFAVILVYMLFLEKERLSSVILAEIAVLSLPCLFWRELLIWPIKSMINSSIDVPFSFSTAEPGFWAAFGMAVLTAVFFQSLVANRPIIITDKKARA